MPGNDILALDEVQTVYVYSHGHHQVVSVSRPECYTSKFAQKSWARSQQFSGFSVRIWEWPLSGYDMPRNLTHQLKRVLV